MVPIELPVSDATIWSITLKSSTMTLDASNTLIYDVYSTGITYDYCQYVYSTGHRPYPQMLNQAGKACR